MAMLNRQRVVFVDLDTSHPGRFVPLLRELGYEISGVYDSGDVHPPQVVHEFTVKHGIERVFRTVSEAVEYADIAFIMGADWDCHLQRAQPFKEAGKALFIDKPFAGNFKDLNLWEQWSDEGVRISGGSSLWYTRELHAFQEVPDSQKGRVHTLFGGCAVDDFNYGIHAFSHALSYVQSPVKGVRFLGKEVQKLVEILCENGSRILLSVGAQAGSLPFHLTLVTDRKVFQTQVDNTWIYESLIHSVMPYLAGEVEQPPVPLSRLLQAERSALLALASEQSRGEWKWMERDCQGEGHYSGTQFCKEYRATRYPETPVPQKHLISQS